MRWLRMSGKGSGRRRRKVSREQYAANWDRIFNSEAKTMTATNEKGSKHKTDPYHHLEFVIGTDDDFICFDYHVDSDSNTVTLHSVVNSETGTFIQDFEPPETVSASLAPAVARDMVSAALDWCCENELVHDTEGWNQDPYYFARAVARCEGDPLVQRIVKGSK